MKTTTKNAASKTNTTHTKTSQEEASALQQANALLLRGKAAVEAKTGGYYIHKSILALVSEAQEKGLGLILLPEAKPDTENMGINGLMIVSPGKKEGDPACVVTVP